MDPVETVTVLFTDLVGSTEMTLRIGPAAAEEVRLEHFGLLREAIAETGGEEVKNLGDGLMVTFGERLGGARLRGGDAAADRAPQPPRRGAALGPDRDQPRRGDPASRTTTSATPVIEAARLCAAAEGDEVLVSDLVRAMATQRRPRPRGGRRARAEGDRPSR